MFLSNLRQSNLWNILERIAGKIFLINVSQSSDLNMSISEWILIEDRSGSICARRECDVGEAKYAFDFATTRSNRASVKCLTFSCPRNSTTPHDIGTPLYTIWDGCDAIGIMHVYTIGPWPTIVKLVDKIRIMPIHGWERCELCKNIKCNGGFCRLLTYLEFWLAKVSSYIRPYTLQLDTWITGKHVSQIPL